MKYISQNPANGKILKSFNSISDKELEKKLVDSLFAFDINRTSSVSIRCKRLLQLADQLENKKAELANIFAVEMGKPIKQAMAEVEKCKTVCHYYAEKSKEILKEQEIETSFSSSIVQYAPLGIVLGVMPWTYPIWQVIRFAIPALVAGNSVLLKHSPLLPQSALAIEQLFKDAHFPENLFQNVFLSKEQVDRLLGDQRVQALAFAGSLESGRVLAAKAGSMIKKSVLELGGNDALIVLADAKIKEAAETAVASRMMNNGQSCLAAKRWIVDQQVAEPFLDICMDLVSKLIVDDPRKPETTIGPMATAELKAQLLDQITEAESKGARLMIGGKSINRKGFFVEPGILFDVKPGMQVFDQEIMGPVGSMIIAGDTHHAIELANNSQFGLGASIWTTDLKKSSRLAKQLKVGSVYVNSMVQSNVNLPFGGIKNSGYGRELGTFGLLEFVNVKTIVTK